MIVWCDGVFLATGEVGVGLSDRGLLLGDGVFETFMVEQGAPRRFPAHMRRLEEAARALTLPLPANEPEIADAARRLAELNGLDRAALRLTLTRGEGPRGLRPPETPSVRMFMTAAPARPPAGPAVLALSPVRRARASISARHKTLSYADNIAALLAARRAAPDADDALILDDRGSVSGASAANIFWVRGGVLFTPSTACAIRPGVTREALLSAARDSGMEAREVEAPLDELLGAEEAFVTNALVGVRSVAKVIAPVDAPGL
ncbi:MAG: aminotransferase class IV [Caulobacterales bacterium]|nr:aminotransferase class IV [Caulobacterales bacterium]